MSGVSYSAVGPVTKRVTKPVSRPGKAPKPKGGVKAPTNFTATAASSSQINLSWTASATPNITGYSLERSLDGSTGWTEIATPDFDQISIGDMGLTPETEYFYRIRAVKGSKVSPWSAVASDSTLAAAIPPVLESYVFAHTSPAGGDIVIPMPSGVEAGDLLIAWAGNGYPSSPESDRYTASAGWTRLGISTLAASSRWHSVAYYRVATGGETNMTIFWNLTNQRMYGGCVRISGADAVAPFNAQNHWIADSSGGSSYTVPSLAHTENAGLALILGSCGTNVTGSVSESDDVWAITAQLSSQNYGTPFILTQAAIEETSLGSCAMSRSTSYLGWAGHTLVIQP